MQSNLFPLLIALSSTLYASAVEQSTYFIKEAIPTPKNEVLEGGAIAIMPDKKVALATRRGDIWVCEGAYDKDLSKVKWTKFATGLHEVLGLFYKDGSLYATSRPEITKLTDTNQDGIADSYLTVNDSWGINGDYHEYNFGSDPDKDGNIWVVHCLTGSSKAASPFRGWAFRYSLDGSKAIPTCSGIRSPGGIGHNANGDYFYTDNQGLWNGSSSIKWLKPGSFQGNPTGNVYAEAAGWEPQPQPQDNSDHQTEYERDNRVQRPAVVMPHGIVGQSPTAIIYDSSKGAFGPFSEQLLVGEQTKSQVQRVFLEKVKGQYQGAAWHLLNGFQSGIVPVRMGESGTLFTAGTNRGWGSTGKAPFSFERVTWTGKTPFEMHEVKVTNNGFNISFTKPLQNDAASNVANYKLKSWTYQYRSAYGSKGTLKDTTPIVTKAEIAPDKMSVRLYVDNLVLGNIHHINVGSAVTSKEGESLWHPDVYYTLNELQD